MQASKEFSSLTMPVFSAFGWAGKKNAPEICIPAQLQLFIDALICDCRPGHRGDFPLRGLSRRTRILYLATGDNFCDADAWRQAFNARPDELPEIQMGIVGRTLS